MIRSRSYKNRLLGAALALVMAAPLMPVAAQSVGAKVGKPLQAAQAALAKHDYAAALRAVNEADAVPNKTESEGQIVAQMRAAVDAASGDYQGTIGVINSGKLSAGVSVQLEESVAATAFQKQDYATAATWADKYFKSGGTDARLKEAQVQAHYLNNDFTNAATLQQKLIDAQIKAGQVPVQNDFDLLRSSYLKLQNNTAVFDVLRQEVVYYPSADNFKPLIDNVTNSDSFDSDRLDYDAGLLKIATGVLTASADYMTLVQEALQGGHSGHALVLYNKATAAGAFGSGSPADVSRQQRLLTLINKDVADDKAREKSDIAFANSNASQAANVGYNLTGLDQQDEGIALLQKSLDGHPAKESIVRLRLGEALVEAGRKQEAISAFQQVDGTDGSQALAQLWIAYLSKKS